MNLSKEIIAHRKYERKKIVIIVFFIFLGILGFVCDIAVGPSMISPIEVVKSILKAFFIDIEVDNTSYIITHSLRLPMAVMALVVGAALGYGGALIQTLLNNPMASPYTLGLAAAAGFGASLVIAFGFAGISLYFAVPLGAFTMTMVCSSVLFLFAKSRAFSSEMLILVGIALLFLFQSLLSLVQYISAPEISQQIVFWLFGSLQKSNWTNVIIVGVVTIICVILLIKDSWALCAFRLGENRAEVLGVNLSYLRFKALLIVSIMSATAISFVGVIGFIGLVSPYIARMLVGEDQRFYMLTSMLIGAVFLSFSSVISKIIVIGTLFPIGIVTSFVGVPFFFFIVYSRRRVC
ncbi:iron ABC transporter permease [Campylobacter sp. RM12651]|uniref:FecCD family ABC transporter permease n=1 Tax=Campylobacter sp. RM12651 TaxID=1660079 RepID=UPI001EFA9E76|nr:iron ABC transporter permease [Campylobacter sp. RM12651]ULO03272.1 iron ABC transporter, permease protein [Campylobacter sp. RM12651]